MRVGIVGSRDFTKVTPKDKTVYAARLAAQERNRRTALILRVISALEPTDIVVSGGAMGVDQIAAEAARKRGLRTVEYYPEYQRYGRAAPLIRNEDIVTNSDEVFAFWVKDRHGYYSHGTASSIKWALKLEKPITVVGVDGKRITVRLNGEQLEVWDGTNWQRVARRSRNVPAGV